jgi:hypothetical protein
MSKEHLLAFLKNFPVFSVLLFLYLFSEYEANKNLSLKNVKPCWFSFNSGILIGFLYPVSTIRTNELDRSNKDV